MNDKSDRHRREVSAHYDTLARYGPYATLAPQDRGGRKSRYVAAAFDAALLPRLRRAGRFSRLLDLGCGTGIFSVQACDYGSSVVGIDVSMAMLESAARFSMDSGRDLHLVRTDGKCLPFATGSFDRLVARESLCYVPDEQFDQLLREVCRVMVSGATFYLLEQVSENPAWQHHPKAPHLKKRPVSEILNAAARAGLVLTEAVVVRQPRFPWIYAVWLGIVPARVIRSLAGAEVLWNRIVCPLRTHRWQNVLFVFRKP